MATPDVKIKISAVDETQKAFQSVEDNLGGLKKSLFSVQNAIKAAIGGAIATTLVKTNAEFQKLQASLETFSGSALAASAQFDALQKFAAKTPFTLQEVVSGFNILKARGIDPTIASFESFGNIAAGSGKSLNQLMEAVADASTGEFERLLDFGIKANKEGDNIKFTFAGVTTSIKNNSTDIIGYLTQLGNTKFGSAMEKQSNTINGAFSNLKDSIDLIVVAIGKTSGFNDWIVESTRSMTGFVQRMQEAYQAGYQLSDILANGFASSDSAKRLADVRDEIKKINAELNAAEAITPGISTSMTDQANRLSELMKMEKQLIGVSLTAGYRGRGFEDPRIKPAATPSVLSKEQLDAIKKAQEEAKKLFDETRDPLEKLNIEFAKYDEMLKKKLITEETYARAVFDATEKYLKLPSIDQMSLVEKWKPVMDLEDQAQADAIAMGEILMSQSSGIKDQIDLVKELGLTFTSAFESAIVGGKGLSSVLKGIGRDILQIATRKLVTEPFGNAITAGLKSWIGGQSWIGGARANGGPVDGNTPYLVGERGPELFVPSSSGSIVPNHAMGGSTVVNQTINVTTGVAQTVRAEIMTLMPQIANAAKSAVADAKLRGGSYAAAMR